MFNIKKRKKRKKSDVVFVISPCRVWNEKNKSSLVSFVRNDEFNYTHGALILPSFLDSCYRAREIGSVWHWHSFPERRRWPSTWIRSLAESRLIIAFPSAITIGLPITSSSRYSTPSISISNAYSFIQKLN